MTTRTLLEPTTASVSLANGKTVSVSRDMLPATLIATGFISSSAVVTINIAIDGITGAAAFQDTEAVVLSKDNNVMAIRSPLRITVSKADTGTDVVGVFLSSGVTP